MRANAAGDMWVAGLNCWAANGYTIGTTGTGACLNISDAGVVDVPLTLTTQELMTDTIRGQTADFVNIDDNVVITGSLTVNGILDAGATVVSNPFWGAGVVNGVNLAKLSSKGRYGYSVARAAGYPVGIYLITMDYAYANAFYVVNATLQAAGRINVWESQVPTASTFTIVCWSASGVLTNSIFHFAVLA
jgi:hypothetical protein